MKKILTAIIAVSLVATATLYGCSDKDDKKGKEENKQGGTEVVIGTSDDGDIEIAKPVDKNFAFTYETAKDPETKEDYAIITGYTGEATEVVIPEVIELTDGKSYKVTEIADYTFLNCEKDFEKTITSITIPEGVKKIGAGAFFNCTSITSLVLPTTLTHIGDYAFYNTASLTDVTMGENIASVGKEAFGNHIAITPWLSNQTEKAVIIGDGVMLKYNNDDAAVATAKHFVSGVFSGCTAESFTFSDELTTLPTDAFDANFTTVLNISRSCPFITSFNEIKTEFLNMEADENEKASEAELLEKALLAAFPGVNLTGSLIIGDGVLLKYYDDAEALAQVKKVVEDAFNDSTSRVIVFSELLETVENYSISSSLGAKVYINPNSPIASTDITHIPGAVVGLPEETTEQTQVEEPVSGEDADQPA